MSKTTKLMKNGIKYFKTRIHTTLSTEMEGVSIEEQLRKALSGKEPIKLDAKIAYTERKDGVLPIYDIRTDRWEIALQASDKVNRSKAAQRNWEDFPELYQRNEDGSFILGADGKPQLIKPMAEA